MSWFTVIYTEESDCHVTGGTASFTMDNWNGEEDCLARFLSVFGSTREDSTIQVHQIIKSESEVYALDFNDELMCFDPSNRLGGED